MWEVLLGARADVDAKEELAGHTPLVLAARFKHQDCVALLISGGTEHRLGPLESQLRTAVEREEREEGFQAGKAQRGPSGY